MRCPRIKKEWLATLDARTRHSHAMLDGEQVAQDKEFSNGCRFPGDPQGPAWEIYNCRCTLIAAVEGVDTSDAQRRARSPLTGETELVSDMTYQEWAGWKEKAYKAQGEPNDYAKNIADMLGVKESEIRISELPEKSQASIERQIKTTLDYFPQLKGHLQSIRYDDTIDAIASSQSLTGVVKVSKTFMDYDAMVDAYARGEKFGIYPKGTSVDSIVVHELGHQIDGLLTKKKLFDGEIGQYGVIRSSQAIQKEILAKIGLPDQRLREIRKEWSERGYTGRDLTDAVRWERKEFISSHVSEYATTNEREFFAECFSELVTSDQPRDAARALGEILGRAKEMLK